MSKESTYTFSTWRAVGKKTLVALMLTSLTFGFSACEKDKTDVAPTVAENPTLTRILALGFNKKDIEDKGTYYLVEGDIQFDKKDTVTPTTQQGVTSQSQDQSHSWELIAYDNQPNLTYTVNSSLPVAAIQDAVNEWNIVQGCRVKLTYTTNSNANITFVSQDLGFSNGGKVLGKADFPDNGTAGRIVRIDPTAFTDYSQFFKFTVIHEVGHTLGFRHTNWATRSPAENEFERSNSINYVRGANGAVLINGTPDSDPNSIMNATVLPWTGFTSNDITAFQNLYPVFATSLGSGYYKILNRATGKSIDVSGGGSNRGNGVQIVQWGDGGSQSEQWSMQSDGSDHYRIINRVINKAIDVNGGAIPTSTYNPGTDVPLVGWDAGSSGNAQSWRFQDVGGGYYKIVNRYTNRCMDVSGGGSNGNDGVPLVQYYYQGHASQQWRLAQ